jgi:hypothetical protein
MAQNRCVFCNARARSQRRVVQRTCASTTNEEGYSIGAVISVGALGIGIGAVATYLLTRQSVGRPPAIWPAARVRAPCG